MNTKATAGFIKQFRLVGILEGASFLILLLIAMPLKYMAGIPEVVKVVGWAHGLLFVLYLFGVAQAKFKLNWSLKQVFFAVVASVVPFGPFFIDRQYLKSSEEGRALSSK